MKKKPKIAETTIERARRLRREMTFPEKRLSWSLCNRALAGLKFRRQHPIGPYFVDFVCEEQKLVIEIDGDSHEGRFNYDMNRQRFINNQGYRVLRVGNDGVLEDLDAVLDAILLAAGIELS